MSSTAAERDLKTFESGSSRWNIGLWVAQALLALAFVGSGLTKMLTPIEQLAEAMPFTTGAMAPLVPFIGFVEVMGAVGLILPAATRIKPNLTPLAAAGLAAVMVLAILTHLVRGEFFIVPNLVLGGLAALVVWGRFRKSPIAAR